ncbi:MAG: hypothetical protein LBC50_00205 [Candidatus Ancillula sp.]|jgi:D-alanyl-D-alanine carboxypeptidase|nr:hypothetical protein [Candidatus Ancillula sp.]
MKKKHFQIIGVVALFVLSIGIVIAWMVTNVNRQDALDDAEVSEPVDTITPGDDQAEEEADQVAEQESPEEVFTPQTATAPYEKGGIIVVNKKHPLPASYNPGEDGAAVKHLKELIAAAKRQA